MVIHVYCPLYGQCSELQIINKVSRYIRDILDGMSRLEIDLDKIASPNPLQFK